MPSPADASSALAPPPAPASPAAFASPAPRSVDGSSVDDLDEDCEGSDAEDAASSDSDYVPGVSDTSRARARKGKKRRLVRSGGGRKAKKRAPVADPDFVSADEEDEDEDEDEDVVEDEEAPSERRSTGSQARKLESKKQWPDDGSAAAYHLRMQEFRRQMEEDEHRDRESFYRKPASSSATSSRTLGDTSTADAATTDADDNDDGDFHNDIDIQDNDAEEESKQESDVEDELRAYGPADTFQTDSGLLVPTYMYAHLYPHQKECLEWLHHLHERNTGGILGDEMGLGKTIQIVAFLGAMHHARRLRTVLLLCPASVLLQWVREFHKWYPPMRVVLLHASGTGISQAGRTYRQLIDEVVDSAQYDEADERMDGSDENTNGGVIISTYENVRQYQELFMDVDWDYVVLDEGHRIRNPDAEITLVCKQFKTVHRLILTGTPIQNRLRELWSLFDFVYPGKLGTLPTFDDEFVLPIRTGGYANASKMQVLMAYKCALVLKDLINPYLLRRTKKEIQSVTKMPEKMEQIIFCNLTERQYKVYQQFLSSPEVAKVLHRDIRPFRAISVLRHICNHPDLLQTMGDDNPLSNASSNRFVPLDDDDEDGHTYGDPAHSGKMLVLLKVLAMWKEQGHRVLLFTQTRKMLDILESLMASLHYKHCRLDGTTNVKSRQSLLDVFNAEDSDIFVFLLTTRAGGIGINLIGADRVLIFDPDWNPSTDLQARERSWRLGQQKQVTIYRLITTGTIEEKIYHRQIFKQYLTTKVLHDAKRKRCFNKHTLRDLFILGDPKTDAGVETSDLFVAGTVERPDASASNDTCEEGAELEDGEEEDERGAESGGDNDSAEEDGASKGSAGDNDAILRKLFDGEGIRGVFNHDAVESDGIQNQEADLIDMESTKIAKSALSALRASCRFIREQRASAFTPTWTGRSGAAGDPTQRRKAKKPGGRFGGRVARGRQPAMVSVAPPPPPSSARSSIPASGSSSAARSASERGGGAGGGRGSGGLFQARRTPSANPFHQSVRSSRDLLTAISLRRNGIQQPKPSSSGGRAGGGASSSGSAPPSRGYMSVDELTRQLHAFLTPSRTDPSRRDGVTTEQVLDAFGSVVAPKDKLIFRKLLHDMAECRARKWRLREDFRDD